MMASKTNIYLLAYAFPLLFSCSDSTSGSEKNDDSIYSDSLRFVKEIKKNDTLRLLNGITVEKTKSVSGLWKLFKTTTIYKGRQFEQIETSNTYIEFKPDNTYKIEYSSGYGIDLPNEGHYNFPLIFNKDKGYFTPILFTTNISDGTTIIEMKSFELSVSNGTKYLTLRSITKNEDLILIKQ